MAQIDQQFTDRLQAWMQSEHTTEESIKEGALMLLQLNRNKILYSQIIANPLRPKWKEKLEYELQKYLIIRLDNKTRDDVIRMDVKIQKQTTAILAQGEVVTADDGKEEVKLRGKREDHDLLPPEIQQIWTRNASRWKKISKLHATLCTMGDASSCDRYEFLKPMDELEHDYRKDMEIYDNYKIVGNTEKSLDSTEETTPEREVAVARTWLSRNRKKLIRLYEEAYKGSPLDMQTYEDFIQECNAQVQRIFDNNGTMTEKLREELRGYGVFVPTDEEPSDDEENTEQV